MLFLCIYFDNFNFRLFQETQLQFNSIFSQKSAQFHLHFARRANKMIRKTKEQSPIATPKTNLFSSPIQNVMDFTDLCSRMYGRNCSNKANAIRPIYRVSLLQLGYSPWTKNHYKACTLSHRIEKWELLIDSKLCLITNECQDLCILLPYTMNDQDLKNHKLLKTIIDSCLIFLPFLLTFSLSVNFLFDW